MKQLVVIVLTLILVLTSLVATACGSKESETTPPASTSSPASTTTATSPKTTASSGSGISWNDMPVYSGATQVQKGSWAIPPSDGEWAKIEWRYYEVKADADTVAAFYKTQMPAKGWQEMGWMEMQGTSWGYFSKNDEKDGAMVWVGNQDNKTFLAIMRASK